MRSSVRLVSESRNDETAKEAPSGFPDLITMRRSSAMRSPWVMGVPGHPSCDRGRCFHSLARAPLWQQQCAKGIFLCACGVVAALNRLRPEPSIVGEFNRINKAFAARTRMTKGAGLDGCVLVLPKFPNAPCLAPRYAELGISIERWGGIAFGRC
jgi:hypothetical protein